MPVLYIVMQPRIINWVWLVIGKSGSLYIGHVYVSLLISLSLPWQEFEDNFDDELDFTPPAEDTPTIQSPAEVFTLTVPNISLPAPSQFQLPIGMNITPIRQLPFLSCPLQYSLMAPVGSPIFLLAILGTDSVLGMIKRGRRAYFLSFWILARLLCPSTGSYYNHWHGYNVKDDLVKQLAKHSGCLILKHCGCSFEEISFNLERMVLKIWPSSVWLTLQYTLLGGRDRSENSFSLTMNGISFGGQEICLYFVWDFIP